MSESKPQQEPEQRYEPIIDLKPRHDPRDDAGPGGDASGSGGGAGAPGVMPYAQSAGCVGAAPFGEEVPPHEPVSGRVLLKGVSKLDYPTAPQRTETSKEPIEARPSFVKWGGFGTTD